jgi:hypothetical protein
MFPQKILWRRNDQTGLAFHHQASLLSRRTSPAIPVRLPSTIPTRSKSRTTKSRDGVDSWRCRHGDPVRKQVPQRFGCVVQKNVSGVAECLHDTLKAPVFIRQNEFWRFVEVQQKVSALAETAVDFPPMQAPASFNLESVKRQVDKVLKENEGR